MPNALRGGVRRLLLLIAMWWSMGWAVVPPSLASFGVGNDPLWSKIGEGASDPPSNKICRVPVIPKRSFSRGLLWSPAHLDLRNG